LNTNLIEIGRVFEKLWAINLYFIGKIEIEIEILLPGTYPMY
jgi:hypothetical protein